MIVGLGLGAGLGFGLFLLVRSLMARPTPLPVALAALAGSRPSVAAQRASVNQAGGRSWADASGLRMVVVLDALGIGGVDRAGLRSDLRVCDRTIERHALDKLVGGVAGLAGPTLMGVVLGLGGVSVPAGVLMIAALSLAVGGFLLPDFLLRGKAKVRRDAFRHALSAYLDLVNVLLAGSAGIETALEAAASAGDGWVFVELRATLERARVLRQSPWDAFASLGITFGIEELSELAASVRLAGQQGAKVKASLAAKAASLRSHQLARTEAQAQAAGERMALPNVVMFVGFLVFIGYPAVVSIIGGQ